MKIKLKNLLSESYEETPAPVDKKQFMEAVKRYSEYGQAFGDINELKNKMNEIKWLVEAAEQVTLQETDQWFDNITVNRHMKQLKEAYGVLEKTAGELMQTQQRFQAAYEDIGTVLGKYYDV